MTCDNYGSVDTSSLKVITCNGKDACKDSNKNLDPSGAQDGVLVICNGEKACEDGTHTMSSGAGKPVWTNEPCEPDDEGYECTTA